MLHYRRVTYEVRCQIFAYLKTKISISVISELTGYHRSTIYREIKRNSESGYNPKRATEKAEDRFLRCRRKRIFTTESLKSQTKTLLDLGWSPDHISGRLKIETCQKISRQTIYNEIFKNFPDWKTSLRRYGKGLGKRHHGRRIKRPLWMKSIHERPTEISMRKEFGHWERDGMFAKDRRQVVVFLERKSRYVKIVKVKEPYCLYVTEQMKEMMRELEVLSLTNDNGNEFMDAEQYKVPVYYCDPGSPNQKGSVENAIGLLRQYIPKKIDLDLITDEEIQNFENKLNHRPRKCLDYKTPYEVLYKKSVALVG